MTLESALQREREGGRERGGSREGGTVGGRDGGRGKCNFRMHCRGQILIDPQRSCYHTRAQMYMYLDLVSVKKSQSLRSPTEDEDRQLSSVAVVHVP